MPPELKRILLTIPFVILAIVMFIWLVKILLPGGGQQGEALKIDDFDRAGYETMSEIRRKECSVMVVGALVILICVLLGGFLGYWAVVSAINGESGSAKSFELILAFIPAIVLLSLIIIASKRYMHSQQGTLKEFRQFQTSRRKALAEYEEKRKGTKKAPEKKKVDLRAKRRERAERDKKRRRG